MKLSISSLLSSALLALAPFASAERMLTSTSLASCGSSGNNSFSASLFDVTFTPNNGSLAFNIIGQSTVAGNVTLGLQVLAYGLNVYKHTINPCDPSSKLTGMCPMPEGPITINSNANISSEDLTQIPGIAFTVPDLDARVRVFINSTNTGLTLACVEAELSNGKTVDQKAVQWIVAVISGLGLVASAITSGLGHSNTAAHVAANALALFGYFQAQALVGMTAVDLPPIVASWTQNFQWSMGIIRVGFLQTLATWYQRSTGGTASQIISNLGVYSVQVEKRSLDIEAVYHLMKRSAQMSFDTLARRATSTDESTSNVVVVTGIERVGFRAGIEPTNIFLTGYIFLLIFIIFTTIGVLLFKLICEAVVRTGHMQTDKFQDFRHGWTTVLKGVLYRIVLIGFAQMVVLCFWEFTKHDSGGEVALAAFTIFTIFAILGWASSKVIRLARRSIAMHKNPAYILYSDPAALNKWGFLYVQFKATAYFMIVPVLIYLLVKGLFVAFGQDNGNLQAIALLIIEAVYLIGIAVLRPYMDVKTNAFNIAICVVNFLNVVFLLIFTGIFNQPGIVTGVIGVVFFVVNAAFSTVLLVMVLVASFIAIFAKDPDTRYQPMRDDRGSFIKSQTQLNTELDALGATARGETKHGQVWSNTKSGARIEDDDDSWSGSGNSTERVPQALAHGRPQQMTTTAYGGAGGFYSDAPRSPAFAPVDAGNNRHMPPFDRSANASPYRDQPNASPYRDQNSRSGSMNSQSRRPQHSQYQPAPQFQQSQRPPDRYKSPAPSPWQRGAGYE